MRVGIAGHQGLPAATARLVDQELRRLLSDYPTSELVGITCLCDGADQLFAQAILDLGGVLEVVVPAEGYRDGLSSPQARAAYDTLVTRAQQVERLPYVESTEQAHMAGGRS